MESYLQNRDMVKISDQEFLTLTEYLRREYGINLSKKRTLIEGRMNQYLQRNGYPSYSAYFKVLFQDATGTEITNVLNVLTTNYSYFMREWAHFDFYRNHILPGLKNSVKDRDLRIWSAGCSTGQEPYTLAMLNDEFFDTEASMWDKRVLATDISQKVLDIAQQGVYGAEDTGSIPGHWRMRYFETRPDGKLSVKQQLKKEVIFRKFNLMEQTFPFKKKFHVIFCRNVMIYFDAKTKAELVGRFCNALADGGYFIVGHSESVDKTTTGLHYVMPSVYKKG